MGGRDPVTAGFTDSLSPLSGSYEDHTSQRTCAVDWRCPSGGFASTSSFGRQYGVSIYTKFGLFSDRTHGGSDIAVRGARDHVPGAPGSMLNNPEGSVVDVSSENWDSVDTFLPQEVLLVDTTNSLLPLFVHRLDVGPLRLTSIAHAFNYCVAVLCDGVKSAARVGRSRKWLDGFWSYLGTPGCCHVSHCVCAGFRGTIGSAGS